VLSPLIKNSEKQSSPIFTLVTSVSGVVNEITDSDTSSDLNITGEVAALRIPGRKIINTKKTKFGDLMLNIILSPSR